MNRRKELQRGKPLAPGKALNRGKGFAPRTEGLPRGTGLQRNAADWGAAAARAAAPDRKPKTPKKPKARDDVPAATRRAALARAGGRCEACGGPLPEKGAHVHHRVRRSQGVSHALENLLVLHPLCHVLAAAAIHQRVAWARRRGFLLKSGMDPATEPILLHGEQEVFLTADGQYEAPPEDWWQAA